MATYSDNLDGTSGDLLRDRSGWTRTLGNDNVTLTAAGSGFYMTGGSNNANSTWHAPTSQPSGNDQYVEAIIHLGSNGNPFPMGVRCDTSVTTGAGYLVYLDLATRLRLVRRAAGGTLTVLGSYTVVTSDLDTNKVRLEAVGDQISVSFMGSTVIGPVTDATITSGSVAMLTRGGANVITTTTVDDWESGEVGAASNTGDGAGTVEVSGAATGALAITGAGAGAVEVSGAGTGSLRITGAGAGTVEVSGSATGAAGSNNSGAGAGTVDVTGGGTGSLRITGAGAGAVEVSGSATGASGNSGTGAGTVNVTGAATGSLRITGAGAGTVNVGGTGTGSLPITGTGAGTVEVSGSATGAAGSNNSGAGAGTVEVTGGGTGSLRITGAGAANVTVSGGGAGSLRIRGAGAGTVNVTGGGSSGSGGVPLLRVGTAGRRAQHGGTARPRQLASARPRAVAG